MKVYTDFVPEGTPYLTPGKRYDILRQNYLDDPNLRTIEADDGEVITIRLSSCAHIRWSQWSVEE